MCYIINYLGQRQGISDFMITYDVISKVHYEIKSITWTCLLLFASDIEFIDESIYFSQTCSSDFTGLRIRFFLVFFLGGGGFSWCVTCSLTCNRSSETFSADKGQTKVRQRSDVALHWSDLTWLHHIVSVNTNIWLHSWLITPPGFPALTCLHLKLSDVRMMQYVNWSFCVQIS